MIAAMPEANFNRGVVLRERPLKSNNVVDQKLDSSRWRRQGLQDRTFKLASF